jgi:hypothetical protein
MPLENRSPEAEAAVRGRRLAVVSLLMVPANLPWLVVSFAVGTAAMNLLGAEEGHLLTEYGAGGWVAWMLMLGFMAVPSIVGVILGVRARRSGDQGLGTAGIVVNAMLGTGLILLSGAQVAIS